MSKKGASRNYKVGPKNHWRRTIWNEILSRTNGREQFEVILYLAGPQDLDRTIAVEKGVPTQNMIAIDLAIENVGSVRDKKCPGISGDIHTVLRSWPESRPVCAVVLDFCCGLTTQAIDVYDLFERVPLRNAVVLVNFMRGRDSFTNAIRNTLTRSILEATDPDDVAPHIPMTYVVGGQETHHLSEKHRALQFLTLHAIETWQILLSEGFETAVRSLGFELNHDAVRPDVMSEKDVEDFFGDMIGMPQLFKLMRPKFYEYKSGMLTFDSAVFQPIARLLNGPPESLEAFNEQVRKKYAPVPAVTRKIAATLAVRTMRQ